MDIIDTENRRIALDRSVQVGMRDGSTGDDETVERADAYLTFLNGTTKTTTPSE